MRMRAPKILNTVNGLTSIAKEVTMHLPQLDEMADVLCFQNTPSVISIGGRCIGKGYAFCWPPHSQNPFFVKPDGTKVIVEVEGNIPYVMNGRAEACVGEEDASGTDDEGGKFGPTRLRDRSGAIIRKLDEDLISKDDVQTYVNIDDVRDETLRVNTDVAPPNDMISEIMSLRQMSWKLFLQSTILSATGIISLKRTDARTSTLVIWTRSILATSLTLSMRRLFFGTLPLTNPN
jgi:hypothetical protein